MLANAGAKSVVSIEGDGQETVGQMPVMQKSERWAADKTIHGETARGPFFNGPNQFAVDFTLDITRKATGERVNLPRVHSVVVTLSQTLKYGTPLAQALRVVAAELRNDDLLKLEEQANRMPVLLTIPMIVFILPSIFLIIGGPAVLKVLDVFAQMG